MYIYQVKLNTRQKVFDELINFKIMGLIPLFVKKTVTKSRSLTNYRDRDINHCDFLSDRHLRRINTI